MEQFNFNLLSLNCKNIIHKKNNFYITKNCCDIDDCFTDNHNLGYISDISFNTFEEASTFYTETNYSNKVYIKGVNNIIYLSHNIFYNPLINRRVSKYETHEFIIYKYLITNNKGALINSISIAKITKPIL